MSATIPILFSISKTNSPVLMVAVSIFVESSIDMEFESTMASCEKNPVTSSNERAVTLISIKIESVSE